MKKENISNSARILTLLATAGLLASCGAGTSSSSALSSSGNGSSSSSSSASGSSTNTSSTPSSSAGDGESVKANGVKRTRADTRESAYTAYGSDGTKKADFTSLYKGIDEVVGDVDTYDYNSYITRKGDTQKIFINREKYNDQTSDMFWYYENNNQLDTYTYWKNTYWTDTMDTKNTVVYISPTSGPLPYFQGWRLAGVSTTQSAASSTAVWNSQSTVESSITVNMLAFSGITKEVYKVDLSKAKIAPALGDDATKTNAFVGFIETDSYNMSNLGLRCDTTTGDWYYYYGEHDMNTDSTSIDDAKCLLTSTWNEGGYFVPDADVTMTMETLALKDNEGGEYLVDRLSMDFSDGRQAVRDYEFSKITQCGTIRFNAGLDMDSKTGHQTDFMNGAYFKDLTVSSATAYAYEEMQDSEKYGNVAALDAGTYDILNSNPESAARYQTIVYGATASYDFAKAGSDVYSFCFEADSGNGPLANAIQSVIDLISALPDADKVAMKDSPAISKARKAYDALRTGERDVVSNYAHLTAAEAALEAL